MDSDLIDKKFKVLDDGFIRLVDFMGSDKAVCQAARVSYGKGTRSISDDKHLIRYMMRHGHSSPFEMCELKFHVRVPMDTWRQWVRHRTANVNEYSTRYSEAIDSCYKVDQNEWRTQSRSNKQGSESFVDKKVGLELSTDEVACQNKARWVYQQRLRGGVARELARKDLPLSTYTEAYWKIDLRNLLHFLALRMDSHAQLEIRKYATVIGEEIVSKLFPLTWAAFNDYHPKRNALLLSSRDIQIIQSLNVIHPNMDGEPRTYWASLQIAASFGWMDKSKKGLLKRNRERDECEEKLRTLGLKVPWERESE